MLQDIRFALRLLSRHRAYAVLAVLTVALGVGANVAIFSVADSALFRPLPFPDADRLFVLRLGNPVTGDVYGTLPGAAIDAARGTGLFDGMAAMSTRSSRAFVRRADGLDALTLSPVSREYLQLLSVRPLLGRTFDTSDAGTRAVLLSHRTWMRRYGGDRAVVGRLIPAILRSLDGSTPQDPPLHVVGVLPPRFRAPLVAAEDGLILSEDAVLGGPGRALSPLVRLKAGVPVASAQAQVSALTGPELVAGKSALRLVPLREEMTVRQGPVLWLLLGASAIVLLVACVNLANLMIARGSARARELAVRAALGGSRARLARLLLVESGCIALFGSAAGLCIAYWGFRILSDQLPPLLAMATDPALDARALVAAFVLACISAAVPGLFPAWRLSRADARGGLQPGRQMSQASRRGRELLVALEIAICLALLVGAGLVGRSLLTLLSQDLGFEAHRVAATFDLPTMVIRQGNALRSDRAARMGFIQTRLREIREVPGVRAAGAASAPPFSSMAPDAPLTGNRGDAGGVYGVSSGYFRAMGIPLLAGRELTDGEGFSGAPFGVLNATAARRLCGNPAACLGHVVRAPDQPARTVVGVVKDVRQSLQRTAVPAMYVPFDVARFTTATLVIDSDDTPENREGLKRALAASPDVRVDVQSLDESRAREASPFRFNAVIVGGFALLTLALAIVGVYGVMSAVVGERVREYGIRLALGATRERVNRHVLRQASVPIGTGLAGGLIVAAWGSRYVASLLYGIVPLDATSFAAAAGVVMTSALIAAVIPARRAGRVDPIVALRAD